MATVDLSRNIKSDKADIRLKTCIVTDSETIADDIKRQWKNPDVSIEHNLTDIIGKDNCTLYIIDTEIQDMRIWPAPLMINKNADAKIWLFLVSGLSNLKYLNPLPSVSMFERGDFEISDMLDFIQTTLNPEAKRQIEDVNYLPNINSFFIRIMNGKVYLLPVSRLEHIDRSRITEWSVSEDRAFFKITQESGNWTEVPWDVVLYHCEPEYEYYEGKERKEANKERARGLGRRVKQLRESRGYSIRELAEKAEMKRPNLSRLEHGRQNPSLETLEKIAGALDVPLVEVVATANR
jgi:DNA-binding XRE family transcriptional regulator